MSRTFNQQQEQLSRLPPDSRFGQTFRQVLISLTDNCFPVLVVTTVGQGKRLLVRTRFNNTWSVQKTPSLCALSIANGCALCQGFLTFVCSVRCGSISLLNHHNFMSITIAHAGDGDKLPANNPQLPMIAQATAVVAASPHTTAAETSPVTFARRPVRLDGLGDLARWSYCKLRQPIKAIKRTSDSNNTRTQFDR